GPSFYRCPKRRKTGPEDRFPYSTYLGRGLPESLAGMDGNRTHPGRLSSAPQTVLKTADCVCATVCLGAYTFDWLSRDSARVRVRPRKSMKLAVNLAVNGRRDLGNSADF